MGEIPVFSSPPQYDLAALEEGASPPKVSCLAPTWKKYCYFVGGGSLLVLGFLSVYAYYYFPETEEEMPKAFALISNSETTNRYPRNYRWYDSLSPEYRFLG